MPISSRLPSWSVLLLYFLAVVAGGSLLAPHLFALGNWYVDWVARMGWQEVPLAGALAAEAGKADFQRYFNRAVLVVALSLIWPVARLLRLRRGEIPGLRPQAGDLADMAAGFLMAAGLLLAMGYYLLHAGVFRQNPKADWPDLLIAAAVAAAAVALLEEFFFRGAITGIVARALSPRATLAFVAVLFAVLHFMHPPEDLRIADAEVGAWTGFRLSWLMLAQVASLEAFTGAFLTLFVVALLLGWARMATGRLWLGIGLHAGWVFALKAFGAATRRAKPVPEGFPDFLIGKDIKTGLLPLGFLLLTGLVLAAYLWPRRKSACTPEPNR